VQPFELLLIEDNAGDVLLTSQVLLRGPIPITLHMARDGEQALQMLTDGRFKPDLVLLDLNIPKVSGTSVLARCQISAPVVIFSSSTNPAEIDRCIELGAREFVPKPSDLGEFEEAVTRIVSDWLAPSSRARALGRP
jgi:two-component system, chemotaxis family, response regulator Rcp1